MIEKNTTTSGGKPVAFHDFPPDAFPFRMVAYDDHGNQLWEETVEGPGVMEIQPSPVHVGEVKIWFADGSIVSTKEGILEVGDEIE